MKTGSDLMILTRAARSIWWKNRLFNSINITSRVMIDFCYLENTEAHTDICCSVARLWRRCCCRRPVLRSIESSSRMRIFSRDDPCRIDARRTLWSVFFISAPSFISSSLDFILFNEVGCYTKEEEEEEDESEDEVVDEEKEVLLFLVRLVFVFHLFS